VGIRECRLPGSPLLCSALAAWLTGCAVCLFLRLRRRKETLDLWGRGATANRGRGVLRRGAGGGGEPMWRGCLPAYKPRPERTAAECRARFRELERSAGLRPKLRGKFTHAENGCLRPDANLSQARRNCHWHWHCAAAGQRVRLIGRPVQRPGVGVPTAELARPICCSVPVSRRR